MANFKSDKLGKSVTTSSPSFSFRFRTGEDAVEELKVAESESNPSSSDRTEGRQSVDAGTDRRSTLMPGPEEEPKDNKDASPVKEYLNRLSKKSTSIDAGAEPSDTWRKLNVLKGKITKTVEDTISEMKIDRGKGAGVLRARLINSKDNSSISDSEDTSESSRVSEPWRDAEETNSSPKKIHVDLTPVDAVVESKTDVDERPVEREVRFRKHKSEIQLPNIKISHARYELEEKDGEVESGVEASEDVAEGAPNSQLLQPDVGLQGARAGSLTDHVKQLLHSEVLYTSLLGILAIILFTPVAEFFRGMVVGMLVMVGLYKLYYWMTSPRWFGPDVAHLAQNVIVPDYKSLPPLVITPSPQSKGAWFNQYMQEYDPAEYSVSQTHSVWLELDGCHLKLSRPKGKIHKRATFDEPEYKRVFISHKKYDIRNCPVVLLPEGLTKGKLFSKKYPIVILLRGDCSESLNVEEVEELVGEEGGEEDATDDDAPSLRKSNSSKCELREETLSCLNLFARCHRQKEEWYRRLLEASRLPVTPPSDSGGQLTESTEGTTIGDPQDTTLEDSSSQRSTPIENLSVDWEALQEEEYLAYMSRFVNLQPNRPPPIYTSFQYLLNVIHDADRKKSAKEKRRREVPAETCEKLGNKLTAEWEAASVSKSASISRLSVHTSASNQQVPSVASIPTTTAPATAASSVESDEDTQEVQWFNALVNRVLYDVFRSPMWTAKIQEKIQKKLSSLRFPWYIEEFEISELDLGRMGPVVHRFSKPLLNDLGLWLDMDMSFEGSVRLVIQTQLNLLKLQKGEAEDEEEQLEKASFEERKKLKTRQSESTTRSAIYDSELEDSAESSEEEEDDDEDSMDALSTSSLPQDPVSTVPSQQKPKRKSSKRILRIVEHVAQSRYFKSISQSRYIQKAIHGVSNTKLKLAVEVRGLVGTLTINIPPPPSDRIWYGFRNMPKLWLTATPKYGDRSVNFYHLKSFIEKKLLDEFKKVLVMPNMDDFVLPTSMYGLVSLPEGRTASPADSSDITVSTSQL